MLTVVGSGTTSTWTGSGTKDSIQALSVAGKHRVAVDLNALAAGEFYRLWIQAAILNAGTERDIKVGEAQFPIDFVGGLQTGVYYSPVFEITAGATATIYIEKVSGSNRAIPWTVTRDGDATLAWKKNTAITAFSFPMRDATGALKTGETVTLTRSIDGGSFGAGTIGSVTEIGTTGIYKADLGAGDLNGTVIVLKASSSNTKETVMVIITQL